MRADFLAPERFAVDLRVDLRADFFAPERLADDFFAPDFFALERRVDFLALLFFIAIVSLQNWSGAPRDPPVDRGANGHAPNGRATASTPPHSRRV